MTHPQTRDRPWVGILLFGLGVALLVSILSPAESPLGFIFGLLGGVLVALGLSIIIRTKGG